MADLNSIMEFDHVVEVKADGSITDRNDIYAPECHWDDDSDINVGDDRWTPLNGYSGQDRYSGPVMHESEYIGGRMEEDIRGTPGVYVAVIVSDLDDQEHPAGWAVMRMSA